MGQKITNKKDYSDKQSNKGACIPKSTGNIFVLSDVTKEELQKRRVPVYKYLL